MKNHIVYYIILSIFSLLPASCGKILTEDVQPRGEEVELVPTLEDVGTKVSVGSWNTDGYGYGAYHPMSWSNSDRITVVSSQQPTVDCIYTYSTSDKSWSAGTALQWGPGTGAHDFFGTYPQTDISLDSIDDSVNPATAQVSASLPGIQELTSSYGINFSQYCKMTAARHVDVPGGRVLIPFSMFCSVVRVSFLNKTRGWLGYPDSYYKHIRLLDFRVEADSHTKPNCALTGDYTGTVQDGAYPVFLDPDADGDISLGNSSYSVTIKNPAVNLPDCYDSTDPWKGAYKTMFVLPQDYSQFRVYFTVEVDGVARPEECAYFYPYNSGNPCCLYLLDVQFK